MSIANLIQRPARWLPPDATCSEAARMMRDENIGSVVVARDRQPLGIVTDRDLAVRVVAEGRDPDKLLLSDVMTDEPIFIGDDRSLDQAVAAMRDLAIRRVPVGDADGRLCGIVSMDDVLILLADQLGSLAGAIREEIGAGD